MIFKFVLIKLFILFIFPKCEVNGENVISSSTTGFPLSTTKAVEVQSKTETSTSISTSTSTSTTGFLTSSKKPMETQSRIEASSTTGFPLSTTKAVEIQPKTEASTSTTGSLTSTPKRMEIQLRMEGRIVNGKRAQPSQFPYIVSIQDTGRNKGHFCGGTLITDRWVVTAAHCLYRHDNSIKTPKLLVVAGEINIKIAYSPHRQKREVIKQIVNPTYDYNMLAHDIGLLLLQSAFLYTTYVFPISLLKTKPNAGAMCTTSGWGYTTENGSISEYLMYVELPIVDSQKCQKLLSGIIYITPTLICAGYMQGGKDACQGDSGGPLVCDNALAGIVSGGRGCARPRLPGFYTNIPEYRSWVEQVMDSDGNNVTFHGISKFPVKPISTTNVGGKSSKLLESFRTIVFSIFIISFIVT